ncbi:MAG: ATP-binding protein [Deltaproteobacteria bacterium]|nr:ATP-binding protein [Deltaproteobacteria bacterium]
MDYDDLESILIENNDLKAINERLQREISEHKRADEKIKKLNEDLSCRAAQLEEANKELEAFSYTVSHDLRGPLTSINGFSQALLEFYGDKLDDAGKDMLQRIYRGTKRMSQLIEDLLDLSLASHGEMTHETIDLTMLAKKGATELQRTQPERKVEFVIADGVFAEGDLRLIAIVIKNLLVNAWKYSARQPVAHIEFGVLQIENGKTAYFVRDNGIGFDIADAEKIFEPFQRLHDLTEFPGTGIGLATVKRGIQRHGGRVWAEGKVGKGATFYFTLPS